MNHSRLTYKSSLRYWPIGRIKKQETVTMTRLSSGIRPFNSFRKGQLRDKNYSFVFRQIRNGFKLRKRLLCLLERLFFLTVEYRIFV